MGFSRQILEKSNEEADEGARIMYWRAPPPIGVFGAPRWGGAG
jgi:hypothetical protein